MRLIQIVLSLVLTSVYSSRIVEVTYEIPQGKIKGIKTTTALKGTTFFGFKGIPYSKPKTGIEKFDPPELPEKWEGVFDATVHGPECVQFDPIFRIIKGDDNCLYLNVYTPSMSSTNTCYAVMVWIHGGAFIFGSGNDDIYGADYLIENNVVVVTINYRLGPIGFLNTQDGNSTANLGLKDQSYALRWVRNNIEFFGGCRDKITIFGESAGAASIHYHLLSPMSRGYFDQAIQQSGTATDEWAFSYYPRKAAFDLGSHLGIKTDDSHVLMTALKKLDSKKILEYNEAMFENLNLDDIMKWVPSVEPDIEGIELFLPDHPLTLVKDGKIADVPMMAGVNLDECALFLQDVLNHIEENREYIYNEMHTLLPNNMNVTDVQEAKDMIQEIYEFYFGDKNITQDTATELLELLNDAAFFIQFHITTLIAGEHIKSPIYKYLLTFRSPEGLIKTFRNLGNVSSHTDDLEYLWHWHFFENLPEKNSSMEFFISLFTQLWTNFAKHGNPTQVQNDIVNFVWEPMGKDNNILHIDKQSSMHKGFFEDRMNFWVRMYDKVLHEFSELLTSSYYGGGGETWKLSTNIYLCNLLVFITIIKSHI